MGLLFWLTLAVLGISVTYDLRFRRIPNWVTFPAMVVGVGYHTFTGGLQGLFLSIGGLLVGFGVLVVFYMLGGMGAGDVKLMAAIGALLGPKDVLFAALYTAIIGGMYAVILIVAQGRNRSALGRFALMAKGLVSTGHLTYIAKDENEKTTPLCYGIAIAVGTLAVLLQRIS
jgi:prepilin peptidase CpaA